MQNKKNNYEAGEVVKKRSEERRGAGPKNPKFYSGGSILNRIIPSERTNSDVDNAFLLQASAEEDDDEYNNNDDSSSEDSDDESNILPNNDDDDDDSVESGSEYFTVKQNQERKNAIMNNHVGLNRMKSRGMIVMGNDGNIADVRGYHNKSSKNIFGAASSSSDDQGGGGTTDLAKTMNLNANQTRLQQRLSKSIHGGFRERHRENLCSRLKDSERRGYGISEEDEDDDEDYSSDEDSEEGGEEEESDDKYSDENRNFKSNSNLDALDSRGKKKRRKRKKKKPPKKMLPSWLKIRYKCGLFINDNKVQAFIIFLIIVNALTMGIGTFHGDDDPVTQVLYYVDIGFLIIYTIEIIMQFIYFGWRMILDAWLSFDLLVVIISWVFDVALADQGGGQFQIIRAFRIFRAFRLLTRIKVLRDLVAAIGEVIPRMIAILMLMLLIFYIFAVLFTELFRDLVIEDEYVTTYNETNTTCTSQNCPFRYLHNSLFTCFELMTLEWSGYARATMEYNDGEAASYAWLPFVLFIFVSGFIVSNLIIAVICDAVSLIDKVAREREALANGTILETPEQQLEFCQSSIIHLSDRVNVLKQSQQQLMDLMEILANQHSSTSSSSFSTKDLFSLNKSSSPTNNASSSMAGANNTVDNNNNMFSQQQSLTSGTSPTFQNLRGHRRSIVKSFKSGFTNNNTRKKKVSFE